MNPIFPFLKHKINSTNKILGGYLSTTGSSCSESCIQVVQSGLSTTVYNDTNNYVYDDNNNLIKSWTTYISQPAGPIHV